MNRERLSIYEECVVIVELERRLSDIKKAYIGVRDADLIKLHEDKVKELTQIINKLKEYQNPRYK